MKKTLLIAALLVASITSFGQAGQLWNKYFISGSLSVGKQVGIAQDSAAYANNCAWLEMGKDSTSRGMLLPRVLHTSSIAFPVRGLVAYVYDSTAICYYTGSKWVNLSAVGSSNTAGLNAVTAIDSTTTHQITAAAVHVGDYGINADGSTDIYSRLRIVDANGNDAYFSTENTTDSRVYQAPDNSGTFGLSVNGVPFDATGDVAAPNFANTNLTLTGDRLHTLNGHSLRINNSFANVIYTGDDETIVGYGDGDNYNSFQGEPNAVILDAVNFSGALLERRLSISNQSGDTSSYTSSDFTPLKYGGIYRANFTPLSLVDKGYVDSITAGAGQNFANADLRLTGDRNHSGAGHSLYIDSVYDFAVNAETVDPSGGATGLYVGQGHGQITSLSPNVGFSSMAVEPGQVQLNASSLTGPPRSRGINIPTDFATGRMTFFDNTFKPIDYTYNTHQNFTSMSLIDKGYADSLYATVSGTNASTANLQQQIHDTAAAIRSHEVYDNGSYVNPAFISSLAWSKITNTPTTISGYNITDGVTPTGAQTLTNKTISGATNTLINIPLSSAVTGVLPIANGGTGSSTQQGAIDNLAGATTSGRFLRGDGSHITLSAIQASDVPTLNQNTTGTAATANAANGLNSTTTTVVTNGSIAPTSGQVLTATGPNAAAWSTPATGVTSVNGTGNNGVSVTGGPITSSGTLTVSLGNITPTSVTSSGNIAAANFSGSSSGTNTGDQTSVTGNSGTTTAALGLKTATTTVSVSSATPPTANQVLTASSGTAATWKTPATIATTSTVLKGDNAGNAVAATPDVDFVSVAGAAAAYHAQGGDTYAAPWVAGSKNNQPVNIIANNAQVASFSTGGTFSLGTTSISAGLDINNAGIGRIRFLTGGVVQGVIAHAVGSIYVAALPGGTSELDNSNVMIGVNGTQAYLYNFSTDGVNQIQGNGTVDFKDSFKLQQVPAVAAAGTYDILVRNNTVNTSGYKGTVKAVPASTFMQNTIVDVTTTTQQLATNTKYQFHNAGQCTAPLPATANSGDFIEMVDMGGGGYKITQATGQLIRSPGASTTTGTSGYVQGASQYAITMQYDAIGAKWNVVSMVGSHTFN